ncbi:MAG: glycoside hydrolase family 97 protein [Bacteroidales bacterium]|nr:glycoside hydrolase family 97 protein [Bacteroidales bacterium]
MKRLFLISVLALMAMGAEAQLKSPDGKLQCDYSTDAEGRPCYTLKYNGETVVEKSQLGFMLKSESRKTFDYKEAVAVADDNLASGFEISNVRNSSFNENWKPVWGEVAEIQNNYNEAAVTFLQKNTQRTFDVVFRLYNDGLGFRYEFPVQEKLNYFTIKDELTEFRMNGDNTAWWIPGDYDTEEYHYAKSKLSEVRALLPKYVMDNSAHTVYSPTGLQTPLLMKTNGGNFMVIHEAALVEYSGMGLDFKEATNSLKVQLTPDAVGDLARMQTPCKTPWRTITVSSDARNILASKLILNLNDPCALSDVSWIKPTKYMGVWWDMIQGKSSWSYTDDFPSVRLGVTDYSKAKPNGRHGATNQNVKKVIDFASANGFDAVLVEGWNIGWEDWFGYLKDKVFDFVTPYPDFDAKMLNDYAHSKGIKLIMHHETSSSIVNYEREMDTAFRYMKHLGYDAVKTGYVGYIQPHGEHHYGQFCVNHYNNNIQKAAQYQICVNGHEAVHPTGLSRTYPNLLANESACGTEYEAFGGNPPDHTCILPFTRLMGGPMDYTPGVFEMNLYNGSHCNSTITGQLALYLTMPTPLQMAADSPEVYTKYSDAFQFIKDVDVDWVDSRYLEASPMEYITVARKGKKSGNWFLATKAGIVHKTSVSLSFLEPGKTYEATFYMDAHNADYKTNTDKYVIRKGLVTSKTAVSVNSVQGGGFAASFVEVKGKSPLKALKGQLN